MFSFFGVIFCEALPIKATLIFVIFVLGRICDWKILDKDVSSVNLFQTFSMHGFLQLVSTRLDSSYYLKLDNTLIYFFVYLFMMMVMMMMINLASILRSF